MSNQITIGAPNREVIALIGKVNSLVGNCDIESQINRILAPKIITAGSSIL